MLRERLKFSLVNDLRRKVKLHHFQRAWRKANLHNGTFPVNIFDDDIVTVGNASYGELHVVSFGRGSKIRIGNYCSIAQEVRFIINAGHRIDTISTFPFKVKSLGVAKEEATTNGDIVIEDDVWIGYRATILDGVCIGQGAVVAAGAVVTKDVEPYSIVGGVPAKFIRRRFNEDVVRDILQCDFSTIDKEVVERNLNVLYASVPAETNCLDPFISLFSRKN